MKNFYAKLFSLAVAMICCAMTLSAQTFVNASASGANNGSSWTDAYTDLSVALTNTTAGDIWVAAGTYLPGEGSVDSSSTFFINSPIAIYGGFNGTEANLGDRDFEANLTIMSGDINGDDVEDDFANGKSDNVQHVFVVDSLINGNVIFDGIDITGANTSDNNDLDEFFYRGGGIFTWSTVEVRNVDFYGNFARSGSGIYINGIVGGGNNSTLENCTFRHQYSTAQSAGVFLSGLTGTTVSNCDFSNNSTNRGSFYPLRCTGITMTDCTFDNNISEFADGFGGAMFNWNSTGWIVTNCTFTNNSAGNGGVMYHDGRENPISTDNLIFNNCTFNNNTSSDFGGGTIYSFDASFTFDGCNFADNEGTNGAHFFAGGANKDIVVKDCVFERGVAQFGGAHNCYGTNSTYLLEGNTYSANAASTSGGALILGFQGNTTIKDCKFVENTANFGGAVYTQNDSTMVSYSNCEFESNQASGPGGAVYQAGGITSSYDNCSFFVNTAVEDGGALWSGTINDDLERGTLAVSNSTFTFNQAGTNGGAIALIDMDATLTSNLVSNNLITGDQSNGGGIFIESTDSNAVTVNLMNNTITSNEGAFGSAIGQAEGGVESALIVNYQNNMIFNSGTNFFITNGDPESNSTGGNLIQDGSMETIFTDAADQNTVADPLFVDQLNVDLHLQELSPAVNAGVAAGAPEFDLDGVMRFGAVDAGAFEFDPTSSTNNPFIDNSALAILPNPVEKQLNFEFTQAYSGDLKMYIYNVNGQLMRQWEGTKGNDLYKEQVEVNELAPGSYRLFVRFGKLAVVQHFVKL